MTTLTTPIQARLAQARESLDTQLAEARKQGLTNLHSLHALAFIGGAEHPPTIGAVATHIHVSGSRVTYTIDSLEELGFVERIRNREDRRECRVKITAQGRITLETILAA